MLKNYYISGWYLYPFPWFTADEPWTLPEVFYRFEQLNTSKASHLFRPANLFLLGIISCAMVLAFKARQHTIRILAWVGTVQIGLCLITQVSIRLAFPGLIILAVAGIYAFAKEKQTKILFWRLGLFIVTGIVIAILNSVPIKSHHSKMYHGGKSIGAQEFLVPYQNTRFPATKFVKKKEGNLQYSSPKDNYLLYNTFNGSLPTVNQQQLEYFKKRFHCRPQKIGKTNSEGFYSQKDFE